MWAHSRCGRANAPTPPTAGEPLAVRLPAGPAVSAPASPLPAVPRHLRLNTRPPGCARRRLPASQSHGRRPRPLSTPSPSATRAAAPASAPAAAVSSAATTPTQPQPAQARRGAGGGEARTPPVGGPPTCTTCRPTTPGGRASCNQPGRWCGVWKCLLVANALQAPACCAAVACRRWIRRRWPPCDAGGFVPTRRGQTPGVKAEIPIRLKLSDEGAEEYGAHKARAARRAQTATSTARRHTTNARGRRSVTLKHKIHRPQNTQRRGHYNPT